MELIDQAGRVEAADDPFSGMFRDEPELLADAVETAMRAPGEHPVRHAGG